MEDLKSKLGLIGTIWEDIDPDLLLSAFIPESEKPSISPGTRKRLFQKYGWDNYEFLEFIGDAVLSVLHNTMVVERKIREAKLMKRPGFYTNELGKNITFYCYMKKKGLCDEIIRPSETVYRWKMCADVFEAIVGALFWDLFHRKGLGYSAMDTVKEWYLKNWPVLESLENTIKTGETKCTVPGGYTSWSRWSECSARCGHGIETRTRTCTNPPPSPTGAPCIDPAIEERECTVTSCQEDAQLNYQQLSDLLNRGEVRLVSLGSYTAVPGQPNDIINANGFFTDKSGKLYSALFGWNLKTHEILPLFPGPIPLTYNDIMKKLAAGEIVDHRPINTETIPGQPDWIVNVEVELTDKSGKVYSTLLGLDKQQKQYIPPYI